MPSTPLTMQTISILDTHTGGEPTRLVLAGGPDLGNGTLLQQRLCLETNHDHLRSAVILEPRGSDVLVGALLCPPVDPACTAGVIFFNNVGYLGMCGHGTIGLITSLAYLGRIQPGPHRIETPVGEVTAHLHQDGRVTVNNVPSYRYQAHVPLDVPGYGRVHGDIAWGGNWFFLIGDHGRQLTNENIPHLSTYTIAILAALVQSGITAPDGHAIDHVELFAPPVATHLDSSNFVMCPGGAYDRSPCGTGTSAKLACLYADGHLQPGQLWRQGGILGTHFDASFEVDGDTILPRITGAAYVTAEATLLLDPNDPFVNGVRL